MVKYASTNCSFVAVILAFCLVVWHTMATDAHKGYRILGIAPLNLCRKLSTLLLKCRLFFNECALLIIRSRLTLHFLMHRRELAHDDGIGGFPLDKPDYYFKMFDKFHSVMWPNDPSSPAAGGGSGGAQPKGTNEK
jgi:hypothetical protein